MAVAETTNDSLASNSGIIYIFKTQPDGSWKKIATLAASDPEENFYLGTHLDFNENLIIAGSSSLQKNKVYVFTKNEGSEWIDATESYSFEVTTIVDNKRFAIKTIGAGFNYLAVTYEYSYDFYEDYENNTNIYEIYGITPIAQIPSTTDSSETVREPEVLSFGTEFIALGVPYFANGTAGPGVVYVHEYDEIDGWSSTPNASLTPSLEDQVHFGMDVKVFNDTIFVANSYGGENGLYESRVFGFNKSETGWEDANESFILSTGITNSSSNDADIAVNGKYLIHSKWYENQVSVFKKDGNWSSQNSDLTFALPTEDYYTNPSLGTNHFIVNSRSNAHAISYYKSLGDFENLIEDYDVVDDPTYSAANFQFGQSSAIYQDKMVIGAPRDGVDGAVYYYEKIAGNWELQSTIRSPIEGDYFGYDVELYENDLFVSVPFADSLNTDDSFYIPAMGKVLYYQLSENGWELIADIKSPDLSSTTSDKRHFGKSISYSNDHVAIGRYYTGSSETDGRVFIYKRNGNNWGHVATMQPEVDSRGDYFGNKVFLQDSVLFVSAASYKGASASGWESTVFIYNRLGNEWSSATEDALLIPSDRVQYDKFGSSFSVSNSTVIVGAPNADQTTSNSNAGQAYVFEKPRNGWYGEINEEVILKPSVRTENSEFGGSVFISDTELFIGGFFHEEGQIFKFDRSQVAAESPINEVEIISSPNPTTGGDFGYSISYMNHDILVSAPTNNSGKGYNSGQLFTYRSAKTYTREEATSCDSYDWQGDTFTNTGLYIKKLVGSNGCDSLKYLDLTILESTEGSANISSCDSYEWEGFTYTESGTYENTLVNAVGCDSTATLHLTILHSTEGSSDLEVCDGYDWEGMTLIESGTYSTTLVNAVGCDSTATLNLTILESSEGSETIEACAPYYWESQFLYTSGSYNTTLTNQIGCDSLATLNLIILDNEGSMEVSACESYEWETYELTESGQYNLLLTNKNGCDSLATLDLTIGQQKEIPLIVNENLIAYQTENQNEQYQWFNCTTFQLIQGANFSEFTISESGSYYLEVDDGVCVSTSDCVYVLSIPSLEEKIYPNPTNGIITFQSDIKFDKISISNINGKSLPVNLDQNQLDLSSFPTGVYLLTIYTGDQSSTIKIVKR